MSGNGAPTTGTRGRFSIVLYCHTRVYFILTTIYVLGSIAHIDIHLCEAFMTQEQISSICKALGDSNRLAIINRLESGELCACRLLEAFQITQPTLSHHMKILGGAGLVSSRKEGKWTYYSVNRDMLRDFRSSLPSVKSVDSEGHAAKAVSYFMRKFSCSQAVLASFAGECGLTESEALKAGACFGSGMRKAEVCGACTGALIALGLMAGHDENDTDKKQKTNEMTVRFLDTFAEKNGSYLCRELLKCDITTQDGRAYAVEHNLFTEFCPKMVESAASILEEMISEKI